MPTPDDATQHPERLTEAGAASIVLGIGVPVAIALTFLTLFGIGAVIHAGYGLIVLGVFLAIPFGLALIRRPLRRRR